MPNRPANISGPEAFHVVNQNIREINNRIDQALKSIPVHKILKTSALLNFGVINANSVVERSVALIGVTQVGAVHVSPQLTLGNKAFIWSAYVSSPGQITVRLLNSSAGNLTPNTVNWNVTSTQ